MFNSNRSTPLTGCCKTEQYHRLKISVFKMFGLHDKKECVVEYGGVWYWSYVPAKMTTDLCIPTADLLSPEIFIQNFENILPKHG